MLADSDVKLHLYGKAEPRPGRKIGPLTVLAEQGGQAARRARGAAPPDGRGLGELGNAG